MVIVYLDRIERLAVRREGKQIELVLDFKAGQQVPLPIPDLEVGDARFLVFGAIDQSL